MSDTRIYGQILVNTPIIMIGSKISIYNSHFYNMGLDNVLNEVSVIRATDNSQVKLIGCIFQNINLTLFSFRDALMEITNSTMDLISSANSYNAEFSNMQAMIVENSVFSRSTNEETQECLIYFTN
jgi:uncharacterized protein YjbI with pentapeptide repeats